MNTAEIRSDDSALQLAHVFAVFGPAYVKWIQAHNSSAPYEGLTYPRIRLLMALHCNGRQMMSTLSEELSVTPRNITVLVDGLEQENLVRRCAHPSDRRATIIELTVAGKEVGEKLHQDFFKTVSSLFDNLSSEEQKTLLFLMMKVLFSLEEAGMLAGSSRTLTVINNPRPFNKCTPGSC